MANVLYNPAKKSFLDGDLDLLTDNIKAVLVDTGTYTFSASHQYLSDIAAGARIATSGNISGKSTTDGVFNGDDVSISSVSGSTVEAIVLYKDTGVEATSNLIVYIDTATSGLPLTPSGDGVIIQWDSSGIFNI